MKSWLQSYRGYFSLVLPLPLILAAGSLFQWQSSFSMEWGLPLVLLLLLAVSGLISHRRGTPLLPQVRVLWRLTLLAAVCDCCCNVGAFAAPFQLPLSIFMTLGTFCVLWSVLRYASLLWWFPFLFLQLAQIGAYLQYGTRLNSLVLAETLEASVDDFAAYLSGTNLLLVIGAVIGVGIFCLVLSLLMRQVRSKLSLFNAGSLFCLLSLLLGAAVPSHHRSNDYYWPMVGGGAELIGALYEAFYHNQATVKLAENLHSPTEKPSSMSSLKGGEGVVLVVHIGESVRKDRMSINGYERNTTPWLATRSDIINFSDCISAAHDTCQAQIAIMTNARRNANEHDPAMQPTTGSVLDLFREHGFRVYSFFGRRIGQQLKYDRVVRLLTACSEERFNAPGSPWTSVPQMQDVLRRVPRNHNILFFINNEGSHTPFNHFDTDHPPFTPCVQSFDNPAAHAEEVNNSYDNTVHYTDEFIRRVCAELEGRPYIYLYVSDHGEFLGHDGIWGRAALGESRFSYHETDGCRVGMFVLTSPGFNSLHPHISSGLAQLRRYVDMTVAHEHIFHTLLGLFGIQTEYYDPSLDLSSPHAQPYAGPMPAAEK